MFQMTSEDLFETHFKLQKQYLPSWLSGLTLAKSENYSGALWWWQMPSSAMLVQGRWWWQMLENLSPSSAMVPQHNNNSATEGLLKQVSLHKTYATYQFKSSLTRPWGRVSLVVATSVRMFYVVCCPLPMQFFLGSYWPWDYMISFQASHWSTLKEVFLIGLCDRPRVLFLIGPA